MSSGGAAEVDADEDRCQLGGMQPKASATPKKLVRPAGAILFVAGSA
jgi:hypothetical protein